jgi:hypothetical protein
MLVRWSPRWFLVVRSREREPRESRFEQKPLDAGEQWSVTSPNSRIACVNRVLRGRLGAVRDADARAQRTLAGRARGAAIPPWPDAGLGAVDCSSSAGSRRSFSTYSNRTGTPNPGEIVSRPHPGHPRRRTSRAVVAGSPRNTRPRGARTPRRARRARRRPASGPLGDRPGNRRRVTVVARGPGDVPFETGRRPGRIAGSRSDAPRGGRSAPAIGHPRRGGDRPLAPSPSTGPVRRSGKIIPETRVESRKSAGHLDRVRAATSGARSTSWLPGIERERYPRLRARPLEVLARGAAVRGPRIRLLRVPRVRDQRAGAERENPPPRPAASAGGRSPSRARARPRPSGVRMAEEVGSGSAPPAPRRGDRGRKLDARRVLSSASRFSRGASAQGRPSYCAERSQSTRREADGHSSRNASPYLDLPRGARRSLR